MSALGTRLELQPATLATLDELERRYLEAVELGFMGPREGDRLRERHLDDALGLAVLRRPGAGERWADLGSGAGLPGLPLAAAFPAASFTLVDSQQRRLAWVERTADALGIGNVEVVHERLEVVGQGALRASFDVAVARALGPSVVVVELGLPLVRAGGVLMIPRGSLLDGELDALTGVVGRLGGGAPALMHNVAASVDRPGAVIIITKVAATPRRFPRRSGVPQRQPLV